MSKHLSLLPTAFDDFRMHNFYKPIITGVCCFKCCLMFYNKVFITQVSKATVSFLTITIDGAANFHIKKKLSATMCQHSSCSLEIASIYQKFAHKDQIHTHLPTGSSILFNFSPNQRFIDFKNSCELVWGNIYNIVFHEQILDKVSPIYSCGLIGHSTTVTCLRKKVPLCKHVDEHDYVSQMQM